MRRWSQLGLSRAFPELLVPVAALVTTSTIAESCLSIGCHRWPSRWDAGQSYWGRGPGTDRAAGWPEASRPQCTMPGPGGQPHTRPARYQTKSSEPVPRQDPGRVAHPKLPALHLHVALLDNVVETGRHGFPTFSWALGLAEARGGMPGWPQFPAPLITCSRHSWVSTHSPAAPHLACLSIVLAAPSPGNCWK